MTNSPDTRSDTHADDQRPPHSKSSNLRWIVGIGGGAIGGAFVGIASLDPLSDSSLSVFIGLTIGAAVGGVLPRVGSLAGLGAILSILAASACPSIRLDGKSNEHYRLAFMLCPLVGCGIGLPWSMIAWVWRSKYRGQELPLDAEAVAATRWDRVRFAWICLVVGLVLGITFGIVLGGPIIVAGPLFGSIAGGTIFLGLMLSAFISGRRK